MKVGIIGNYGATNIGDDAILTALLKDLSGHKVTVFSASPEQTGSRFGVATAPLFPLGFRSFLKEGILAPLKALRPLEAIILGGGGLFQDSRPYACFLWAWQIFWVRRLKKPLFICAAGVGPLKTGVGKWLTKWAFGHAQLISVRDNGSRELLDKIGIPAERVHVVADPAFTYKVSPASGRPRNVLLVSVRPWLGQNGKIIDAFTDFLQKLKDEKGMEIVFVSMQGIRERDALIIEPVMRKVGGQLYIPKHFADLLHEMQGAEYAIGMRYHFLIAAMITKTPLLPVSYSPKVESLFSGTPLSPYLIHVEELTAQVLSSGLKRLSVDYNNVEVYEEARTRTLRELAEKNQGLLAEFLKTVDHTPDE